MWLVGFGDGTILNDRSRLRSRKRDREIEREQDLIKFNIQVKW